MNPDQRLAIIREVALAGQCSHPIRLRGELLNGSTGEILERTLKVACKDRRESVCVACSRRYAVDAWIIAAAGINGGKGVPDEVRTSPRAFVTVTGPSFGRVHTIRSDGKCVPEQGKTVTCVHGIPTWCGRQHSDDGLEVGHPLCWRCFDYQTAVLWNVNATKLWNVTMRNVRNDLARVSGLSRSRFRDVASLQYFKVAELQRRGVVHFHGIVRLDVGQSSSPATGAQLDTAELCMAISNSIRRARVVNGLGDFSWGSIADVQALEDSDLDGRRLASYLAKYVTKTAGSSTELARRFHHRRQIKLIVKDEHLQRMALTTWDMSYDPDIGLVSGRRHANSLGYSGHPITKSREYSTTFGELRDARTNYFESQRDGDPIEGTFFYEGRGYDDPLSSDFAEVVNQFDRELREASRIEAKARSENQTSRTQ